MCQKWSFDIEQQTNKKLLVKKLEKIDTWRELGIPEAVQILIFGSWTLSQSQIQMSWGKFQRSQYICVKCTCSRSIGNNSAEWRSGIQKATHWPSLAHPLQRFMGPQRGGGLGWDLEPGRGFRTVPCSPCSIVPQKSCPRQSSTSSMFAQRKNKSFSLSLNHCNRPHRAAAWARAERIFLVSEAWPPHQFAVGRRQVPSLWTSVNPCAKWESQRMI